MNATEYLLAIMNALTSHNPCYTFHGDNRCRAHSWPHYDQACPDGVAQQQLQDAGVR